MSTPSSGGPEEIAAEAQPVFRDHLVDRSAWLALPTVVLGLAIACSLGNPSHAPHLQLGVAPHSLAMHPDNCRFAVGSTCGQIQIRDLSVPGVSQVERGLDDVTSTGRPRPVSRLRFAPDGGALGATCGEHSSLSLLDAMTLVPLWTKRIPAALSLAFSRDGQRLAVGTRLGHVHLLHRESGESVWVEHRFPNAIESLAFCADGRWLAAGTQGGEIGVWDVASGTLVARLAQPFAAVIDVGFSDTDRLWSVHLNQTVTQWEVPSGRLIAQRLGSSQASGVDLRPTAGRVVLGGRRGMVRLLDVDRPDATTLQYLGADIAALDCSDSGRHVVVVSTSGDLCVWDLTHLAMDRVWWIPGLYTVALVAAGLMVFNGWRQAVLVCVVLEGLRDPARKLAPHAPIAVTLGVSLLWGLIFAVAGFRERKILAPVWRKHRCPIVASGCLCLGLIPSAVAAIRRPEGGLALLALGITSYAAPLAGIVLGYLHAGSESAIRRVMIVYLAVHGLLLIGVFLEFGRLDLRGLSGIDFDWVRYHEGGAISLISGFYRSPDLQGQHAAQAAMFLSVLLVYGGTSRSRRWASLLVPLAACLVLCGRRKMMVAPLLFLAVWLGPTALRAGWRQTGRMTAIMAAVGGLTLAAVSYKWPSPYLTYMTTIAGDSRERVLRSVDGVALTLQQAGWWGYGLGGATQGRAHVAPHDSRVWQEDALSRSAAESGVPGLLVMLGLAVVWSRVGLTSWGSTRDDALAFAGMSLAWLAVYFIAHGTFSSDPATALFAAWPLGVCLGGNARTASPNVGTRDIAVV